jgi:histidine triad (HIT) family protein
MVAKKIKQEFKPIRVGVLIEGFEVPHAHVKVLPINSELELRRLPDSSSAPSQAELAETAKRLKIA